MKIRIFGESHAPEIGVEIEGVPKGTVIDGMELQTFLDRRAPGNGQGGMSTPRKEADKVEFESGVVDSNSSGEDAASPLRITNGETIRAVIRNTNVRPQDYANVQTVPRPGHADYASWLQCGKIPTGGGKWSGRMTAPLCIAGGIALQILKRKGVTIASKVVRCGGIDCGGETPPPQKSCPDGDSVGGVVEVVATGFPAGYGDVGEAGLESKLAAAFFGIPAVKGVEFGDGFRLAEMFGSEANDAFVISSSDSRLPSSVSSPQVTLRTNHCGGILGGVSVGMPIVARLAFKPTPSIALEQDSVDLATMTPAKITVKGRHDRCVAFRGAVAAEAAMAIVLADELGGARGEMRAGLLGRKLGHSLSPQIHRFFGDYEYRLYEKEPDEVEAFLRERLTGAVAEDRDSAAGVGFLNVTIPYKQTVFALCDELTPMARRLGNVNFVTRTADGRICGDNTDAFGVGRLLEANGIDVRGWNCAILGAGGAAMTVKAVLEERGAQRVTFVRRGEAPAQDDDLIVNATPVGMWPNADDVRVDISQYVSCKAVLDLVYNPSPTRLVREARACGKVAADGMVMLIAQAYRASQRVPGAWCPVPGFEGDAPSAQRPAPSTLFLYGPPASGKSTWAKRIAAATGWALVDLDAEIVKAAGRGIPEIFAADGEGGFRRLEKQVLERVCADAASAPQGRVVALGGGALLDPACRAMVEAAGRVVVLDCELATLKARLTGGDRPLSADTGKLESLVAVRLPHYASFQNHVKMV